MSRRRDTALLKILDNHFVGFGAFPGRVVSAPGGDRIEARVMQQRILRRSLPVDLNSVADLVEGESTPHVPIAFPTGVKGRLQVLPSRRPLVRVVPHVIDNEVARVPHGVCIRQSSKDVEQIPPPP